MKRPRIIHATDFSESNGQAFELACLMAQVRKGRLVIAHVNDTKLSPEEFGIPETNLIKEKLDKIEPKDLSIDFEHVYVTGDPAKSLVQLASEQDAELIVMGTHGKSGLDRVLFGSVAEQVMRKAPCPVLTVRKCKRPVEPGQRVQKILVPTDYSLHSYIALDFASKLAKALNAGMTILAVDDSWEAESDEQHNIAWQQLLKVVPTESDVDYGHKLLAGQAHEQVVKYANDHAYDFIVMGTHGRTGASRVILGSVAERVVRHADCAVLTVKLTDSPKPVISG